MSTAQQPQRFTERAPYRDASDIDYPQENVDGQLHAYRCKACKLTTTTINGRLENHKPDCAYRLSKAR